MNAHLPPPNSPFWEWSKSIAIIGGGLIVLGFNASEFDETELKAIAQIAAIVFGAQGLHGYFKGQQKRESDDENR